MNRYLWEGEVKGAGFLQVFGLGQRIPDAKKDLVKEYAKNPQILWLLDNVIPVKVASGPETIITPEITLPSKEIEAILKTEGFKPEPTKKERSAKELMQMTLFGDL